MGCSCQIDVDVDCGNALTTLKRKIRTARKPHRCSDCGIEIAVGQQYESYCGVGDGEIAVYKTCLDCLSVRDTLFCSWYFERLWEDLQDEIDYSDGGDHLAGCLSELTPRAREMVCERLEAYWAKQKDEESEEV